MILKKRLDETIHDKFIEDLYTGRYHAGERIDPAEMAMECSISRTPVVQALKQLANEKVLTVSNGGKFFMVIPDQKMLDDVCDVRCLLEQHAISIMDFSLLSPLEFFADPKNGDGRNNQPPAMRVRVDCYTKKLPFRLQ